MPSHATRHDVDDVHKTELVKNIRVDKTDAVTYNLFWFKAHIPLFENRTITLCSTPRIQMHLGPAAGFSCDGGGGGDQNAHLQTPLHTSEMVLILWLVWFGSCRSHPPSAIRTLWSQFHPYNKTNGTHVEYKVCLCCSLQKRRKTKPKSSMVLR